MLRSLYLASLLTAVLGGQPSFASTYSEFVDGDLSDLPSAPTHWVLDNGMNILVGETGAGDPDLLWLTIPAGYELRTIIIEYHQDLTQVFTGLQSGSTWTAGIGFDVDPAPMLGWVDFPVDPATAHTGVDILTDIGQAPGSQGFAPPLPSGEYAMLFQNAFSTVRHALSFNIAAVGGSLAADFDHNDHVDEGDLEMWSEAFGENALGDANFDGSSNGADFLLWQSSFGFGSVAVATSTVPEPGAFALVAIGLLFFGLLKCSFCESVAALPARPSTSQA